MRFTSGPGASNIYRDNNKYQLVLDWSFNSIYFRNNDKWIVFTTNKDKVYYKDNKIYVIEGNNIEFENDEFNKLKKHALENKPKL